MVTCITALDARADRFVLSGLLPETTPDDGGCSASRTVDGNTKWTVGEIGITPVATTPMLKQDPSRDAP